jgi:RNA polymerase sigma-70 factor, ECF subfamily
VPIASRLKTQHIKNWGAVMQTNDAGEIHPATHSKRCRRDTLDVALLESVIAGDEAALRVLFTRHNVRVYRFVLQLTGNRSIAEEIVSDVFLEAWRHAARFGMRSQVSTWLLAIARNKALTRLRRRSESQLSETDFPLTIEDPDDNPEQCLDKQDRGRAVRLCLKQLSRSHREVIDLVYYHGKSVGEVAEIVGIPASTVKTRMHYARSRMAMLLKQAGIGDERLT